MTKFGFILKHLDQIIKKRKSEQTNEIKKYINRDLEY